MTPYDRLKRLQPAPQMAPQLPPMQPAPQGMPMQYISGVGDEAGGGEQGGTDGISQLLGQYLKGRQSKGGAMPGIEGKA